MGCSLETAAAFYLFSCSVDGLTTWAPEDKMYYIKRANQRAEEGYAGYVASKPLIK